MHVQRHDQRIRRGSSSHATGLREDTRIVLPVCMVLTPMCLVWRASASACPQVRQPPLRLIHAYAPLHGKTRRSTGSSGTDVARTAWPWVLWPILGCRLLIMNAVRPLQASCIRRAGRNWQAETGWPSMAWHA